MMSHNGGRISVKSQVFFRVDTGHIRISNSMSSVHYTTRPETNIMTDRCDKGGPLWIAAEFVQ